MKALTYKTNAAALAFEWRSAAAHTWNVSRLLVHRLTVTAVLALATAVSGIGRALDWFEWIVTVSIVRRVSPQQRDLERYEYESLELRRGGFSHWL